MNQTVKTINKQEIQLFRSLFPPKIDVIVNFSEDGGFYAKILTFPGCVTQAETFAELIEMVNDAVTTILEIPQEYLPYMPTYLPPLSLVQGLNVFPSVQVVDVPITFSIYTPI